MLSVLWLCIMTCEAVYAYIVHSTHALQFIICSHNPENVLHKLYVPSMNQGFNFSLVMPVAPWWWFPCKPKHVGPASLILKCFNNCMFFNVMCVIWTKKCWISIDAWCKNEVNYRQIHHTMEWYFWGKTGKCPFTCCLFSSVMMHFCVTQIFYSDWVVFTKNFIHEVDRFMVVMAVLYPIMCGPCTNINISSFVATKIMQITVTSHSSWTEGCLTVTVTDVFIWTLSVCKVCFMGKMVLKFWYDIHWLNNTL